MNNPNLDKPYLLDRETFERLREENKSQGSQIFKFTKSSKNEEQIRFDNLTKLNFGVHEWLHNKALNGCLDSIEKLEYFYDLYSEVLNKAKEEGLI